MLYLLLLIGKHFENSSFVSSRQGDRLTDSETDGWMARRYLRKSYKT